MTTARRLRSHFDWPLALCMLAIAAIGMVNLYSATRAAPKHNMFEVQVWWMVTGLAAMVLTTIVDYRVWIRFAWFALGICMIGIIAVHYTGHTVKGSRRWLGIGPIGGQPSEFMKIAAILALARIIHDSGNGEVDLGLTIARAGGLVLSILAIAWQPDLGTAVLVALICITVMLLTSKRILPILASLFTGAGALPLIYAYALKDYQKKRILTFLDPTREQTGAGWHARQSIFAIGSGRLSGKGFLHGTQNQFNFLPEHWTDFPFAVWGEEWGFAGAITLLGLYVFLILWIINVASQARDRFGATVCIGVAAMFFWHVVVNIAMVTGLAPVVGVTLPFVSYGGSSVLTMFIGLGLVGSVSMRRWAV